MQQVCYNQYNNNNNYGYDRQSYSRNNGNGNRRPRNNNGQRRASKQPTPSWPMPFPRPDPEPATNDFAQNRQPNCSNRIPQKEIPHGDNSNPVCLDYLKGVCSTKRWKCKYAHPPLWLVPKGPATERHVCTVFVLTGFCKYGDRCFGLHPPLNDVVCKPAQTSTCRNHLTPDHLNHLEHDDTTSHDGSESTCSNGTRSSTPPPQRPDAFPVAAAVAAAPTGVWQHQPYAPFPTPVPQQQPVQIQMQPQEAPQHHHHHHGGHLHASPEYNGVNKALGLLNKLTPQRFDSVLKQLFSLLTTEGVTLQQVLPLVFRKAATEPLSCHLYAQLSKHLHDLVPHQQQPEVFNLLCDITNQLFYQDLHDVPAAQAEQLKMRLLGTTHFVGELYLVGLFSKAQMASKLDHLVRKSKAADQIDADFAVEAACTLLTVIGGRLAQEDPMNLNMVLSALNANKVKHPLRSQCLVDKVNELQARGWVKRL